MTSKELEKGLKFLIYDGICTQSMGILTGGAFLVAFALDLGASNFYIGLLPLYLSWHRPYRYLQFF